MILSFLRLGNDFDQSWGHGKNGIFIGHYVWG